MITDSHAHVFWDTFEQDRTEVLARARECGVERMVVVGTERTNIENGEPVRNTTDYPFGTYKSLANLLGFGVGYNF